MKKYLYLFVLISLFSSVNLLSQSYSWRLIDSSYNNNNYSYNTSYIKDKLNYICGGLLNNNFFARYTTDGGRTWNSTIIFENPEKKNINRIFWGEGNNVIAISDFGDYYTTTDLINWNKSILKHTIGYGEFKDADYKDGVLLISYDYEVFRSFDFGKTWELLATPQINIENRNLVTNLTILNKSMYFIKTTTQYMEDEYGYRSTDGGVSWELFPQIYRSAQTLFFNQDEGIGYSIGCDMGCPEVIFQINRNIKDNVNIYIDEDFLKPIMEIDAFDSNNIIALQRVKGDTSKNIVVKITDNYSKIEVDDSTFKYDNQYSYNNTLKFIDKNTLLSTSTVGHIFKYTNEDIGIKLSVEDERKINLETEVSIFPNPSSDKILLDLGGIEVADLVVYDILGNEIMSIPNYSNKSEIDISTLSIGTYTIQIQTNTGSISQRLLVNR